LQPIVSKYAVVVIVVVVDIVVREFDEKTGL
jgi:hypothetical protein